MTESSTGDTEILCLVCLNSTLVPGFGCQFGTVEGQWGDGVRHAGEHYRIHLCEGFFFRALENLREERRIQSLFSDVPCVDPDTFGRV